MATYPNDAVGNFTIDTFSSMADRRPDRGYSESQNFSSITFTSEAGYEKRRLKSRRPKRTFSFTYTNVNGLIKQAIQNFYRARSGDFESFTFDLDHVSQVGTMTARFDGELAIQEVRSGASNVLNDVYSISFTITETYD